MYQKQLTQLTQLTPRTISFLHPHRTPKRLSSSSCPLSYRSSPATFALAPTTELPNPTSPIYVVGGLYGNTQALKTIINLASKETSPPNIIFNGDFNFFNIHPSTFSTINSTVLSSPFHLSTAGNIEREISTESSNYIGCGCSYPSFVSQSTITRSDKIVKSLHSTCATSTYNSQLGNLPNFMKIEYHGVKIAVLHGDFHSLSGWSFSAESMPPPSPTLHASLSVSPDFPTTQKSSVIEMCEEAGVDIVTCTHTCLPYGQKFTNPITSKEYLIFNSGSAGISNFSNTTGGIITRITAVSSITSEKFQNDRGGRKVYESNVGGIRVEGVEVVFDDRKWREEFLMQWPEGSAAYDSYWGRITGGVEYWDVGQAAREGVEVVKG